MPVVSFLVLIPKPKRMPLELETPCLFIRYVCIIIRHKNLKAKRLLRFFFLWPFGVPVRLSHVLILHYQAVT